MASLTDQIQDLQNELLVAKEANKITPQGEELLTAIKSNQWATGGFGQFLQGLSLNFSDEAIGALKSFITTEPASISKALKQMNPEQPQPSPREVGTAVERMGLREYSQEKPLSSVGAQIVGAMTPSLLTKKPMVTSLPAQVGLASAAGATAGLGETEAQLFSPEAGKEAGFGAGIAATGTLIAKPVGMVAGKIYRSAVDSMFSSPQRLGVDQARGLIREALDADVGGVNEAVNFVLSKTGKPYSLADVGPNSRAYLDAVNVLPGPGKTEAKKFLEERDKGIFSRLTTDLQTAFGKQAEYFDEFNALKSARAELGKKLYGAALPRQVEVTPEFTQLLDRPSMKQAYERAAMLAQEQGIKLPKVQISPEGKLLTDAGGSVGKIDTTFMHYMKMGLDDLIFTGKSPSSGMGNTQLNAIRDTRREFIDQLDKANPAYGRARNFWANDTAVLDAMQEGRSAFSKKPADLDQLIADVKDMSKSEKEGLRLGVMQSLMDRLGGAQTGTTMLSPSGNPALDMIKNPKNVRVIRETFGSDEAGQDAYKKFMGNLMSEIEMKTTSKVVLQGSQTAARTEAVSRIRTESSKELPAPSVMGILMNALRRDYQGLGEQQLRATADEMARMLTTTDPTKLQRISKELSGRTVSEVLRKNAPEVLPALGRGLLGPMSIGSQAGNIAPNVNQAIPLGGLFSGQ